MVWGSFNKMMNKILSGETGKKIANTLYRNTIEAPLRVLEFGDKYGITPTGLTKTVDKLIYQPIRQTIDAVVEKGKKKDQPIAPPIIPNEIIPTPAPSGKWTRMTGTIETRHTQPDGSVRVEYPDGEVQIIPPRQPVLSTSLAPRRAYLQPDNTVRVEHPDGRVEILSQ